MSSRRLIGLIGNPLSHSFSHRFFSDKFSREGLAEFEHKNFEIQDINQIYKLLAEHPEMLGFNVTYPYKQRIIPLLNEIDPRATAAGAVNTVKVSWRDGKPYLLGYNTDIDGFRISLDHWLSASVTQALVLGTGGAAGAVREVLSDRGINPVQVSRNPSGSCIGYKEVSTEIAQNCLLWINCTPLGMQPFQGQKPELDYNTLTEHHQLYDLVYNPPLTPFMEEGIQRGAQVKNGYDMLVLQAESSWEIWTRQVEQSDS